ncbi:MAG: calcium-binding protein, partial [Alphaproteobacteria bacterium]
VELKNSLNKSTFISGYDLINSGKISQYYIPISNSRVQYEPFRSADYYFLNSVEKIDFKYNKIYQYQTKNFYNNQNIDITGYNQSLDSFYGNVGNDLILMTNGNDYISFDDNQIENYQVSSQSRIDSVETIMAFDGDDIINFSSPNYQIGDILIRAGSGNDKIFSSSGNDLIFGEDGDDEIFSGSGNDIIAGGFGANKINSGDGNDLINAIFGKDKIFGENGDDTIIAGEKNLKIDGGEGSDLIDFTNFKNGVLVDLTNNLAKFLNHQIEINGIENIDGSSFDDIIYGNGQANIIKAGGGNDKIYGGGGDNIYLFENNHGADELYSQSQGQNTIKLNDNLNFKNINLSKENQDLIIHTANDNLNKISVKNYYDNPKIIKYLKLNQENFIDISAGIEIKNEDEEIVFDENFYQKYFASNLQNVVFLGFSGSFLQNPYDSKLIYKPKENHIGFDEINFTLSNLNSGKITLFYNSINDAPIGEIKNFKFDINQEINIDFNNYFHDPEGGKLNFELALDGYNQLPDWLNFNNQIGILSTKIFRSGNLNFGLKIYDNDGLYLDRNFKISVIRNISQEAINIANKNEIKGDIHNNIIIAESGLSDFIEANSGDDEIFFTQDETWDILSTDDSQINFSAWNVYSGDRFEVKNKIRSFDCFDGGDGYDILNLTENDDALFLDDQSLSIFGAMPKFNNIEEIRAGKGDDIIDMTSFNLSYGNIKIYGGDGHDILWSNGGDDEIFGEFGNDNIQGGTGNDYLDGGSGNDIIKGYDGNDICYGNIGADIIYTGKGSDILLYENIQDSTLDNSDVIKDFDIKFDKFWFKNLKFNSIQKNFNLTQDPNLYGSQSSESVEIANDSNILYFEFDQNNNTRIFDKNSDFNIILEGVNELSNYNIF